MTSFVVITLLLRVLQHVGCCMSEKSGSRFKDCEKSIVVSGSLRRDVAVLQRLAQSANPAEPAVWCRWKDSKGRRWFSLCSILWEPQRVNDGKCMFMFWHRSDHKFCFSPSTGNWSLWGDQQSRYTCSRWISQSMLYVLSHMLVILKFLTLDLKWNRLSDGEVQHSAIIRFCVHEHWWKCSICAL